LSVRFFVERVAVKRHGESIVFTVCEPLGVPARIFQRRRDHILVFTARIIFELKRLLQDDSISEPYVDVTSVHLGRGDPIRTKIIDHEGDHFLERRFDGSQCGHLALKRRVVRSPPNGRGAYIPWKLKFHFPRRTTPEIFPLYTHLLSLPPGHTHIHPPASRQIIFSAVYYMGQMGKKHQQTAR